MPQHSHERQTDPEQVRLLLLALDNLDVALVHEAALTIRRLLHNVKRLEARLFMSEPRKMAVTTFHPQAKEPNHE